MLNSQIVIVLESWRYDHRESGQACWLSEEKRTKTKTEYRNQKIEKQALVFSSFFAMILCFPWTCATVDSTELSLSISIAR